MGLRYRIKRRRARESKTKIKKALPTGCTRHTRGSAGTEHRSADAAQGVHVSSTSASLIHCRPPRVAHVDRPELADPSGGGCGVPRLSRTPGDKPASSPLSRCGAGILLDEPPGRIRHRTPPQPPRRIGGRVLEPLAGPADPRPRPPGLGSHRLRRGAPSAGAAAASLFGAPPRPSPARRASAGPASCRGSRECNRCRYRCRPPPSRLLSHHQTPPRRARPPGISRSPSSDGCRPPRLRAPIPRRTRGGVVGSAPSTESSRRRSWLGGERGHGGRRGTR